MSMSKKDKQRPSLDQPSTYQIIVPGRIDTHWFEWDLDVKVSVIKDDEGLPVTTMTVFLDQAALQGLLRRLYSFGLPLISVNFLDVEFTIP
jgi:hypothetical protein